MNGPRLYTRSTFICEPLPQQRALACITRTPEGRFQLVVSKDLPGPNDSCLRVYQRALEAYNRIVGLVLGQIAIDGTIIKAPGGREAAGGSPVDRGEIAVSSPRHGLHR